MVTDAEGTISDAIKLQDTASKGKSGGTIWLNMELKSALGQLLVQEGDVQSTNNFVRIERSKGTSAQAIVNMFACWYRDLGFDGCSSHSGRRTFITNAARKILTVGGSMRDVQILARHASLNMTMRYVDADKEAMRKVVELV